MITEKDVAGPTVKGGDIGLGYLLKSSYFIINIFALSIYPICRYSFGMT